MAKVFSRVVLISLALLMCCSGFGQSLSNETVVRLPAFVRTKDGGLIKNLSANDLEVFEDGTKLKVELEGKLEAPATIGIVLDLSGSVGVKTVEETVERVVHLVAAAPEKSEFFLCLVWRDDVLDIETTTDRKRVLSYLDQIRRYKPYGNTRLFDGVRRAIDRFGVALFTKRVLVVISDGNDNSSKTRGLDLLKLMKLESVVTYTVNILERGDLASSYAQSGQAWLIGLTEVGGGRFFGSASGLIPAEPADKSWPKEISDDISNMYLIKTTVRPTLDKTKWRKLDVRLTKAAKDRLGSVKLRARRGIYL